MDFISNLIKRPISLVLNEHSDATAEKRSQNILKPSAPLPIATNILETERWDRDKRQPLAATNNRQPSPGNTAARHRSKNIIELADISDLLVDLEDIKPSSSQPKMDFKPPSSIISVNKGSSSSRATTPSTPSQTIEQLLIEINDNFNQAGLMEDVFNYNLAASPHAKHSPLMVAKAASFNTKMVAPTSPTLALSTTNTTSYSTEVTTTTTITATTTPFAKATGASNIQVHQPNPTSEVDLSNGNIYPVARAEQNLNNTIAINKSLNKSIGFVEFDENEISSLRKDDGQSHSEEQVQINFEECMVPDNHDVAHQIEETLSLNDKAHFLSPTETDTAVSSDNEHYTDCTEGEGTEEERDPLADSLVVKPSANTNIDLSSRSELYETLNNTMDSIKDITMDSNDLKQEPTLHGDEEPMDVDTTLEYLNNSTSNPQRLEQIIKYAENVFEHLEAHEPLAEKHRAAESTKQQHSGNNIEHDDAEEENPISEAVDNNSVTWVLNNEIQPPVSSTTTELTATEDDFTNPEQNSTSDASHSSEDVTTIECKKYSVINVPSSPINASAKSTVLDAFKDPKAIVKVNNPVDSSIKHNVDTSAAMSTPPQIEINGDNSSKDVERRNALEVDKIKRRTFNIGSSTEINLELESKNKRYTFNVIKDSQTSPDNCNSENIQQTLDVGVPQSSNESEFQEAKECVKGNKRRTFNILPEEENQIQLQQQTETMNRNQSIEPMDIDPPLLTSPSKNKTFENSITTSKKLSATNTEQQQDNIYPISCVESIPEPESTEHTETQNDEKTPQDKQIMKQDHVKSPECMAASIRSIQKRPSIKEYKKTECLSAKEQTKISVRDEKDSFDHQQNNPPLDEMFAPASAQLPAENSENNKQIRGELNHIHHQYNIDEHEFDHINNNLILQPSDFDYLLTKGNNNVPVDRSSLLMKFDPLLGVPVPVGNQAQSLNLQKLNVELANINNSNNNNNNNNLSPTQEEEEEGVVVETDIKEAEEQEKVEGEEHHKTENKNIDTTETPSIERFKNKNRTHNSDPVKLPISQSKLHLVEGEKKRHAIMSVDVDVIKDMSLDNDCNKTYENSNTTQTEDKQQPNYNMDELEKKIKNEVLKTEDIEKKLKDAEQREEALIKRITEKDKTISKMNGVVEAYEKAIAEFIAEKEELMLNYEKQLAEVKADRDSYYHHLTSLETTFSDLHVKYEKSKEMTFQLKANEESLLVEKRQNLENLRLQEQRYEKMKNHAMQQLEIANKKLESLTKEHAIETTKLKALLKKEEIARISINEQLVQKTKENNELMKICDELIQGQSS